MGLSLADVQELLKTPERVNGRHPRREQIGPFHVMDGDGRCCSRNCNSPTHYQICGVWYCMVHAADLLNRMIVVMANGNGWNKAFVKAKEQIANDN